LEQGIVHKRRAQEISSLSALSKDDPYTNLHDLLDIDKLFKVEVVMHRAKINEKNKL